MTDETPVRMRVVLTYEYDALPSEYGTDNPFEMAMMDANRETVLLGAELEDKLQIQVGPVFVD